MISRIARLALSAGLSLILGFAVTPAGCGGTQEEAMPMRPHAAPERPQLPNEVVEQLKGCIDQGAARLTSTSYAIVFDVKAVKEGDVRSAAVKDSIIGDKEIESCMTGVLESMSLPASVMTTPFARLVSRHPITPASRALVGNPFVIVGGVIIELIPIVIVAAGITIVVGITIEIVHEAISTTTTVDDPLPIPAPSATAMPTATATPIPTDIPIPPVSHVEAICYPRLYHCLDNPTQPPWNRHKYGGRKDCVACFHQCERHRVWPDDKCPYN